MHIILGIIAIVVIGLVMQAVDAVGGWPNVFLFIAMLVGGGFGLNVLLKRTSAIKDLKAMPGQVETLMFNAEKLARVDAEDFLRDPLEEYLAGRAPTFWERFDKCCDHVLSLMHLLDGAHAIADAYAEGARQYNLFPKTITFDDEPHRLAGQAMARGLHKLHDKVLTEPHFAVVYEQRRQGAETRARQQEMWNELAAKFAAEDERYD